MSTKVTAERKNEIADALKQGKAVIINPDANNKFKGHVFCINYPRKM